MRGAALYFGAIMIFLGILGLILYYPSYQALSYPLSPLGPELLLKYYEIERYVYAFEIALSLGLLLTWYGLRPETPVKKPVEKSVVTEFNEGDLTERMSKLKNLYDDKSITEEEYNKRKLELLRKI